MKCISCNNDIFKKYADDSNLDLPVFCCKKCGLFITGNSESEIIQKINPTDYNESFRFKRTRE